MRIHPDDSQLECLICEVECPEHYRRCAAGGNPDGEGCPYRPWYRPVHARGAAVNILELRKRRLRW